MPTTLEIRMTRPNRARSIPFDARFTTRNAPPRLVATTESKSSSLIRISSVSFVMPAFATTTSTGPSSASTTRNAASSDAASVTSACTASTPSGPEPFREVIATRWPSAANARAIARPMPRLPPVTRTVRCGQRGRLLPQGFREPSDRVREARGGVG